MFHVTDTLIVFFVNTELIDRLVQLVISYPAVVCRNEHDDRLDTSASAIGHISHLRRTLANARQTHSPETSERL